LITNLKQNKRNDNRTVADITILKTLTDNKN